MNKRIFYGMTIAIFAVLSSFAFAGVESTKSVEVDENGVVAEHAFVAPGDGSSYKAFTLDTLTNTANDTLSLPFTFASRFTYSVHVTLATISGTRALKVYLDEANALSGSTGWVAVDSITSATAIHEYKMDGSEVYGRKHRIRVDGNAGATQSVSYRITANYKRQ